MWDGWELVPVGELLVLERGMVLVIEQVVEVVQVELDKGALDHEHGVAPRLDQIEDELHRTRDQARVLPVGRQTPNANARENSTPHTTCIEIYLNIATYQHISISTYWRTYSVPNMVCVLPEPV
jgi:hypothetical protein